MDLPVGLELLLSTLDLQCKSDVIVALVHWTMIISGFKCIGIDDQLKLVSGNVRATELLPSGWNSNCEIYTLKYILKNGSSNVFLIKIAKADSILLINALNSADNKVVSTSVPVDEINEDFKSHESAFKNGTGLYQQLKSEITDRLRPPPKAANPKTDAQIEQTSTRTVPEHHQPQRRSLIEDEEMFYPIPLRGRFGDDDPLAVGHGDLDPLGRSPGGMLMDPRRFPDLRMPGRGGGLPRGAIPPGARFDPFGPPVPDSDRRRNPTFGSPDPDHLPPPGSRDDMFS